GVGALALAACQGNLGDPPGPLPTATTPQALDCRSIQLGDSPVRRLTRTEYNNTVRDLLGDTSEPANDFVPEEVSLGFDNQSAALVVSKLLAEQYMSASESISVRATNDLTTLLPCHPSKGEAACATKFIKQFGKRAFRRPIDDASVARLQKVYE